MCLILSEDWAPHTKRLKIVVGRMKTIKYFIYKLLRYLVHECIFILEIKHNFEIPRGKLDVSI